jgi:hypothetical protein
MASAHGALPSVGRLLRAGILVAWIPPVLVVGLVVALAAIPALLLGQAIAALWRDHVLLHAFALAAGLVMGYLAFCFALLLFLPTSRFLLRVRSRAGTIPLSSVGMAPWYHQLVTTFAFRSLAGPFFQAAGLYGLFVGLMGGRVGRGAIVNSRNLYDLDLLDIGEGALIGGDAYLVPHLVEHGRLLRAPIRIGRHSSVGLGAVLLPGAVLGDNCHVGALSLVPKGAVLDGDAVYAGVPARKVRDLRRDVSTTRQE